MEAAAAEFNFDEQAKNMGFMIGIPNEIYMWSVSRNSTLYVEYHKSQWIAWRETYMPSADRSKNYKMIAQGSFELAMARTKKYMKSVRRTWDK